MPKRREPGRFVRIPLGDGFVGWGRQLSGANVRFYERFDPEPNADSVSAHDVIGGDTAFTVAVMDYAFRRDSKWLLHEVVPLTPTEQAEVHRKFKQDPLNGALSIYWEGPGGTWGEDPATSTECVGLERAAVWDPEHVEGRLRDLRVGRPNAIAQRMKFSG